jgi:hypothetical protein
MRKITLEELERACRMLAAKRHACGDGLLQDALEIGEAVIRETIRECREAHTNFIVLEDIS